MAAGSNRDVILTLSVETLGEEGIKALETSVRTLAQQGGAAGPEFQQLADEIARLGQQTAALQSFKTLADETERLGQRQEQTATRVRELSTAFETQQAAVVEAQTKLKAASDAVVAGQKAYNDATAAIKNLRNEFDAAGKNTEEYRVRMRALVDAQTASKNNLIDLRVALRDANGEYTQAAAAQGKLETSLGRATTQAAAAASAFIAQETALRDSSQAAQALGVSTDQVATAEGNLLSALNAAGSAADKLAQESRALAKASEEAAAAERQNDAVRQSSIGTIQRQVSAQLALEQSFEQMARVLRETAAEEERAAAAARTKAAADAEMADSNRLLAIQQQAANELLRRGADALAAERAAVLEATQTANLYTAAKKQQAVAEKEAADQAKIAAAAIDSAFSTLGVRSVQQVEQEIQQVKAALVVAGEQARTTGTSLAGAFASGEARLNALQRELRELNGTLTTGDKLAGLFKNSLGQIAAGNIIADGVGYLVNKVKELGVAFITTIAETERLRRGLNAVYGDTRTTAAQIDFLRKVALESGVAVGGLQQNFVKFSAAMKSTNVPLEQSNALFEAVTRSAGTLGLSGEQVSGMLEALGQMASKGTVSLEELRQQLGDRLPGAIGLAAKGFGITTEQLIALVTSGQLATKDFIVPFTNALRTMQGEVSGLTPTFENLKTALTTSAQAAGDAGWTQLLILGIRGLAVAAGAVVIVLQGFSEGLFIAGKAAIAFYEALRGNADGFRFLNEELTKSRDRLAQTTELFYNVATGTKQAQAATEANTEAQKQQAAAMQAVSEKAAAVETSVRTTSAGMEAQRVVSEALAKSSGNLGAAYVSLSVKLTELASAASKNAEAADKEAKATKINGDALVALAGLRGSERDALIASTQASEANVAALEKANSFRQAEVEVLSAQRAALVAIAGVSEAERQSREAQLKLINEKLVKAAAEAEQSKAAVVQAQNEVAARQLASKAYEDNSASLEEFRVAAVNAQEALVQLEAASRAGIATDAEVSKARRDASQAMGLYNDALKDSVARIKALSDVEQANINIKQAGLSVQKSAYEQMAAAAKASGNLAEATYYEIEAKRTQIKITEQLMLAKKLEYEAAVKGIEAERMQLESTNSLTPVKRLEIEARLANAKAKLIESQASADVIKALNQEIETIQRRINASPAAIGAVKGETSALGGLAGAYDRVGKAATESSRAEDEAAAKRKRRNVDAEGFSLNTAGQKIVAGGQVPPPPGNASDYTFDEEAANRYLASWRPLSSLSQPNLTQFWKLTSEAASRSVLSPAPSPSPAPTPAAPSSAGSTGSYTVNVTIGGQVRTISAADKSSADAMVQALEEAYRAGGG